MTDLPKIDWEAQRRDGLIALLASGDIRIEADGHRLLTCGSHTGHTVRAIAYCDDAAWAEAIAKAVNRVAA